MKYQVWLAPHKEPTGFVVLPERGDGANLPEDDEFIRTAVAHGWLSADEQVWVQGHNSEREVAVFIERGSFNDDIEANDRETLVFFLHER